MFCIYTLIDPNPQRFGSLQMIGPTTVIKDSGHRVYELICDCGNKTYSLLHHLKNGSKKSCGCMRIGRPPKTNEQIVCEIEETDEQAYRIAAQLEKVLRLRVQLRAAQTMACQMRAPYLHHRS